MANKMLGILITKHANFEHIAGVIRAARKAGHPVTIFITDEGVRFTKDQQFLDLLIKAGVENAVCEYSCELLGLGERTAGINYGSQYDNAWILHDSVRVLVF